MKSPLPGYMPPGGLSMGTAREVGAGGLENCDHADRAEHGEASCTVSSYFGAYLTLRVRVQATFTGGAKEPSSCSMNESGRGSAGLTTGVGPALFAGLGFRRIHLPDDARSVLPGNVRRQAGRKLRQGSAKPCCSA